MVGVRRVASVLAPIWLAALLVLPGLAGAQMREFSGKVDRINKKEIIVDNRMGDKVKFVRVDETVVEGEKDQWRKVRKNDWVTVSWKMVDKPRKAYRVQVLPPREEAGEDFE